MPRNKSRLLVDPRLVILAVGAAIGAPVAVVSKPMDVVERFAWGASGLLAWWYLLRCVKEMWARRRKSVEPDDTGASGTA
ncbi:hypothetical protein GCM10010121_011100 [Streptomyces brasiliensis]|uniref:Uncharacterized protein n=1 Tax=Streptomyces brasiliensis TaxID=1954 RepID=A0A917K653_9ACTN|nr:hypothetical protein GCM10010121_011100 [Streptomyces brasiliensis]